ncbi:MAG: VapC toxin family PIN domain ribonuclease, partial [Mycobacterium sp.]
ALLRVHLAEAGRRVRVNALWIAVIAAAKHLPVVTQDGDFHVLEGVAGLAIIHV